MLLLASLVMRVSQFSPVLALLSLAGKSLGDAASYAATEYPSVFRPHACMVVSILLIPTAIALQKLAC